MPNKENLKNLIRRPPSPEEILALIGEVRGAHDRAVGIIMATLTEDALEGALRSRFVPLTKQEDGELFGPEAPLGSFSAKIRVAYAIKLINKIERNDLVIIKDVRNALAHARRSITFYTPAIADKCLKLVTGSKPRSPNVPRVAGEPKAQFVMASRLIAWMMEYQQVSATPPRD